MAAATEQEREPQGDRFLLILDDPIVGLAPWLAWGLLPYVTTALVSALVAAALALAIVALTWWRGEQQKVLELSDVVLFVPLIAIAIFGSDDVNEWFEDHADLLSNGGLTLMAVVSLLINRPFTAPYTSARFPGLALSLQRRLDTVSTLAWAIGLGVATVVAYYGEFILGDSNNFWTGWVLQLLPLVIAYHATLWFDERAVYEAAGEKDDEPTWWKLVGDLVIWAVPLGLFVWMLGTGPIWMAEALAIGGVALFLLTWAMVRRRRTVVHRPFVRWDDEDDADDQIGADAYG
ncbi:MAG: hypothetical protein U0R64_03695 [Candidatus Nanopelagicales bacterium]